MRTSTKWVSIDQPEFSECLEDDDVHLCGDCDGLDEGCEVCRGYFLVSGHDSNGLGYPVVLASRFDPERDVPAPHYAPEWLQRMTGATEFRAAS